MVDWLAPLDAVAENPLLYLPLLYVFALLSTLILPIPVEIGLLNPFLPFPSLILVLALGKASGSALVFPLGRRLGDEIRARIERFPRFALLYAWVERWIERGGYAALFLMLAIPFMTDTAPLYAFTILHPGSPGAKPGDPLPSTRGARALLLGPFVAVNFAAGVVRGSLFLAIPLLLGWH